MHIPVYVINMKGSEERWTTTNERLTKIGIHANRFSATVGKNISNEELVNWYCPKKNKSHYHRNLTAGEIGCYISHMRIWQKMVDEQIAAVVVLEDDLHIQPSLPAVVNNVTNLENWDLIKLSDNRDNPFIDTRPLKDNLTLGNYLKAPNGTQGYIISLSGAEKMLQRKPFFRPIDVDMQFHSEVNLIMLGVKPYPISEDLSFDSEIVLVNNNRHSNRSTLFRNIKHRIRLYLQRKTKTANINLINNKHLKNNSV